MARYFTLDEARQLIPVADRAIRDAIRSRVTYQEAEETLSALTQRIFISGGMTVDRVAFEALKTAKQTGAERLQAAMEELEGVGCLIKDLHIGLIDFPTLYRGEEVYLCWQLGEEDIRFWHGVQEGFAGRKAIDEHFVENHSAGAD
jgi:hypothetical protein